MVSRITSDEGLRFRVRLAIQDSGLAQREVAHRLDLEETKLSKSLSGTRQFRPEELADLAAATGVTVSWLVSGTDDASGVTVTPSAGTLPARHREGHEHAQKRRAIVEEAWWLFAKRGPSAVRISDIAVACGVSKATVHYYFPTKGEIFTEALRYSVKLAYDRQVAELRSAADPVDRLRRLVALQLPAGERGRAEFSIWLHTWSQIATNSIPPQIHTPGYLRWYQSVHDVIREGQRQGSVSDVPAEDLATELTALMDGLGIRVLTGLITVEDMHRQITAFIDRAIVRT